MELNTQTELVKLLLPEGLLNYFEVTKVSTVNHEIWIYIEELNDPPIEYRSDKLLSKGFLPEICIQDFPLRGKKVLLYIKRRRWLNTGSNDIVLRDWNLVQLGTRITSEFASFLKEISR
jgi:hypothetical protein